MYEMSNGRVDSRLAGLAPTLDVLGTSCHSAPTGRGTWGVVSRLPANDMTFISDLVVISTPYKLHVLHLC